jgi:hypothetical protein
MGWRCYRQLGAACAVRALRRGSLGRRPLHRVGSPAKFARKVDRPEKVLQYGPEGIH